jgi:ferric-dicitrate binding protein FerR (iron transport regulator)
MSDADRDDDEDDAMSLIRLAGQRDVPSAQRSAEARALVHAAWRSGIRRRRLRTALLAAAAGLAAMALALLVGRSGRQDPHSARGPLAPGVVVARLDVGGGGVERETASGWVALSVNEPLPAGSQVRCGGRGAGFRLEDGRSVRLGAHSRLRWVAFDRLALEAGAVYVDSGRAAAAASSFEVQTSWGAVRETGTQFEVRLEPAALRVRVREGRVAVLGRGPTLDVASGTELSLTDAGPTRRDLPAHGPEWSWVMALAPAYEIEGRPLHDLLAWASREAGWELRYADAESRRRAQAAELHGSIRGLSPDQAAIAVIPTTGLSHRLEAGVLEIGSDGARDAR